MNSATVTPEQGGRSFVASLEQSRWVQLVLWIFIPLALFGTTEIAIRHQVKNDRQWYPQYASLSQPDKYLALFVGTSRVGAAIDPKAFEEAAARTGREVVALNLGQGYSKLNEHYFGLRQFLKTARHGFSGFTVFIEAPAGIPSAETWNESWYYTERPDWLVNALQPDDMGRLWRSSMPLEDKLSISVRFAFRFSQAVSNRERFRMHILGVGRQAIETALVRMGALAADREADLSKRGGIRTDERGVQEFRRITLQRVQKEMREQTPLPPWRDTVLADIVKLVKDNGGQLCFYQMPLSSVQMRLWNTDLRQKERAAFVKQARAWGTPILSPPIHLSDDCFPDLVHLASSSSPYFTRSISRAWQASLGQGLLGSQQAEQASSP